MGASLHLARLVVVPALALVLLDHLALVPVRTGVVEIVGGNLGTAVVQKIAVAQNSGFAAERFVAVVENSATVAKNLWKILR